MKRSVVMAGIVVAAMSVAPTTAFADTRPAAVADDTPADCRGAAPGAGGGSGSGEPTTGGDGGTADPGADDTSAGDKGSGDKGSGDKGSGGEDSAAGEAVGDEDPPADEPGGSGSGGQVDPGEEEPAGDTKQDEPKQDEPKQNEPKQDEPKQDEPEQGGSTQDDPERGDAPAAAGDAPVADPAACPEPAAGPAAAAPGAEASAASIHKWGTPNRVDEFDGDLSDWSLYDGEGHAGEGRRSPEAASVKNGVLTIDGNSDGTTAGMAWNPGQKYGRWEGRVRAPASDESYNALLLLWPDAEDFPVGGEVDFMEMSDHTRQETEMFLHYGADNSQVQGKVKIDATQWHNWAVEWTPEKITAFVDGKEWWSTTDTSILPPGPMHLCIQLDWFPGSGSGDVSPSTMEVDWVRQYSLPESEQGEKPDDSTSDDSKGGSAEGLLDGAGQTLDRLVRRTEGSPDPAVGSSQRAPSHT